MMLLLPDLAEQIAAVEREIKRRQRYYPARIKTRRLSQAEADRELAAMQAVRDTLVRLAIDQGQRQWAIS